MTHAHRGLPGSIIVPAVVIAAVTLLCSCPGLVVTNYYERAVVVTATPIATAVGDAVFREGGNAFDAAVAVGFALAVVHPEAGNIADRRSFEAEDRLRPRVRPADSCA